MAQVSPELQALIDRWCKDRDRFPDSARAWSRTYQLRRQQQEHPPYRCPVCRRYHVGEAVAPDAVDAAARQVTELLKPLSLAARREVRGEAPRLAVTRVTRAMRDPNLPGLAAQRYLADREMTVEKLAAELGASEKLARAWLRQELVPLRRRRKQSKRWVWRQEDVDLVVEMVKRGLSRKEIADRFGVAWATVARATARFDVDLDGLWPAKEPVVAAKRPQPRQVRESKPRPPREPKPVREPKPRPVPAWTPPVVPVRAEPVQRAVALRYLLDRGLSLRQLARIFELTVGEVSACLCAELVPERRGRQDEAGWSAADVALVQRMAANGWSVDRVLDRFEVSKPALRDGLRRFGVQLVDLWPPAPPARRYGPRSNPRRDAAVERFRRGGVDVRWLAAEFEVGRTTVRRWLSAAGLDPDGTPPGQEQNGPQTDG